MLRIFDKLLYIKGLFDVYASLRIEIILYNMYNTKRKISDQVTLGKFPSVFRKVSVTSYLNLNTMLLY